MGSLVVALRTRDAITVAIDSREVRIDPSGRIAATRDDKCKMFEQDSVVFALAGIAESTADFDVMALARRVIRPRLSLAKMADEFQRVARPAIEGEFRRWRSAPGETSQGIPGLHYLFAKSENGVSSAVWGGIAGFRDARGSVVAQIIDANRWPGSSENVVMFGKTGAVTRALRGGGIGFRTEADAGLVALEMMRITAADPDDGRYVGGPTDMAIVRTSGIAWSRQKPTCRAR